MVSLNLVCSSAQQTDPLVHVFAFSMLVTCAVADSPAIQGRSKQSRSQTPPITA